MAHSIQAAGLGVFSQALMMTLLATSAMAQVSPTISGVSQTSIHEAPVAAGRLSLDQALHMAVDNNPDMAKAAALIERARGVALSARVRPNPELGIEAENIGGSGAYKGTDSAEMTYGLSQKIELGGKRKARIDLARVGSQRAAAEAELIRHELIHSVKGAYMRVLAAETEKENAASQMTLADKILKQVNALHAQGGESRTQLAKARVMREEAELDMAQAEADISTSRQTLAMLMGKDELTDALDRHDFTVLPAFVDPTEAEPAEAPVLRQASLTLAEAEASLVAQRSLKTIDPTIGVGVRQFRETRDNAMVVNLSVPIPLFDRNQGGVVQAGAALAEAKAEKLKAQRYYRTELARMKLELENRKRMADKLSQDVVPSMEGALTDLLKGYATGRNSLLDVQDVNRSLRQSSAQLVKARLDYHLLLSELQHFTATHSATDLHTLEQETK